MNGLRRFLLLLLAVPLLCLASPLRPLEPGDFEALKQALKDKPFIVSLWGLDCPHCRPDLERLADFANHHPGAKILVVSTDSQADEPAIRKALARSGLKGVDLLVFGDAAPERLRFEIDRNWGGELPRNYLFDANGSVRDLSGALTPQELSDWARRNGVRGR